MALIYLCVVLRHLVTALLKLLAPATQAIVSLITEVLLASLEHVLPFYHVLCRKGPSLVNMYTADIIHIAHSFGVTVHCYADDLQLYVYCTVAEAPAALQRILGCIEAIDSWMGSNRLKLNPGKTQLIWLGTKGRLATLDITPVRLHEGTVIKPSTSVRNLGVIFDSELSMLEHVSSVIRACFYHLQQLRFVRYSLIPDCAKMLVYAFFSSKVDYRNSLLYSATVQVTRRSQVCYECCCSLNRRVETIRSHYASRERQATLAFHYRSVSTTRLRC